MLFLNLAILLVSIALMVITPIFQICFLYILAFPLLITSIIYFGRLFILQPKESMLLMLVGTYKGKI